MHRLRDFKNFDRAALDLFAPLTILLGRNGSGKTNLIEGVELMAALARGVPVNDIADVGRGGVLEVRGGLASCGRFGASSFQLGFNKATVRFGIEKCPVDYFIEIGRAEAAAVYLAAERLKVGNRVFFEAHSAEGEILDISYDNFSPGPNPHCQFSASSSVLSRYNEVIANSRAASSKLPSAKRAVAAVTEYLQGSYIFDPMPKLMRNYERINPEPRLLRNGGNLSAVLFALSKGNEEQKAALGLITDTIRQIPEEPFQSIGFVETSLGDVMAGFLAEPASGLNGGRLIDARLLSDGTLRMLAVLTALATVPPRSRIVIEEFDAGLHPSRAELLIQRLAGAAERRELNLVLTTHNPAFMNALTEAQMESVWICHRDDERKASSVTRLTDLDALETIGLTGGLGDFVASGALERRLAPSYSRDRKEAMCNWVESFESLS